VLTPQQIESLPALRAFNRDFLDGYYKHAVLIDGHDPRRIDVGVLSVFPITDLKTHIDDLVPPPGPPRPIGRVPHPLSPSPSRERGHYLFSRDCLEVTFDIDGAALTVFVNHLKSQLAEDPAEGAAGNARR